MKLFKDAHVENKQLEELASLVSDYTFKPDAVIFEKDKKIEAALYIVHEGYVQLTGSRSDVIHPGDFFGEDQLLLDAKNRGDYHGANPTTTLSTYSAKAVGKCVCGVVTLSDCRKIFDTTTLAAEEVTIELLTPPQSKRESMDVSMLLPTSLHRETTQQWLTNSSKALLRENVRIGVALEDFERHSILGEGQFGEVWLVTCELANGRHHFALKSQWKEDPTRGNSEQAVKREIDVLRLMDHPFIVNLVHHYEDEEHLYILMGLVHGGELFDVIHQEGEDGVWTSGIPEDHAKFYAMVVADTLDYIHRKHFVFRDLKPENILIDEDGYPVICDFGFGRLRLLAVYAGKVVLSSSSIGFDLFSLPS